MRGKNNFISEIKKFFSFGDEKPDYIFLGLIGFLVLFGLLILSSASSVLSFQRYGDSYYMFRHQLFNGVIPGILAFLLAYKFNYRKWQPYAVLMLLVSIVMLVLVFIPGLGAVYNGAKSWVKIGMLSFQPSEIVKFTFLIYLASWLTKSQHKGLKFFETGFWPFISLMAVIVVLMLLEPDTGSLLIIAAITGIVYFAANAPIKNLAIIALGGLVLVLLAVQLAPYRVQRLSAFMHPERDPQGIGYHTIQAKMAVASGGILGLGIGKSRQKFNYLPEVAGDSIYAIIAEETGFIFSTGIVLVYLAIFWRGVQLIRVINDQFAKLLVTGVITWISFQALVNIGAMVAILPLTGVPLPFVSYGGTSMVVTLMAVGVVANISQNVKLPKLFSY